MSIGEALKRQLLATGERCGTLARSQSMNRNTIRRYLDGGGDVFLENAVRMADACGFDIVLKKKDEIEC